MRSLPEGLRGTAEGGDDEESLHPIAQMPCSELGAALELFCPLLSSLLRYSHAGEWGCGILWLWGGVGGLI